jgi:hypothetical protein
MRAALLSLAVILLAHPAEGRTIIKCFQDPWERDGLVFVPEPGHTAMCRGSGKLTVKSRDGRELGVLDGVEWGHPHYGQLPAVIDGKIIWRRTRYDDQRMTRTTEVRITDVKTWRTDVVPVPHAVVGWWAASGSLGAFDGYHDATVTLTDTIHVIDPARGTVVATANVETLPRWPKERFHINYLKARNAAGDFYFLLGKDPSASSFPPTGPFVMGLYRRGKFEYHELAGVDYAANISVAVSPKCMQVAVITGTGTYHEMPHAIWLYDLVNGTKQVLAVPPKVTLVDIAFDASGDLTYKGHDHATSKEHKATLRMSSCPQSI